MNNVDVVRVFLASPGDLTSEREAAREVVDEVNRGPGREAGVLFELIGWEDTIPGAGRPQALINADVESCDVFVGIVWKRWGRPTGTHSSGFAEEFSIASRRLKEPNAPILWLAFKTIDQSLRDDPGEQVAKVLEFKEKVADERTLLYKEFETIEQWRRQLTSWLSTTLVRRVKGRSDARSEGEPPSSPAAKELLVKKQPETAKGTPLPPVLKDALREVGKARALTSWERFDEALAKASDLGLLRILLVVKSKLGPRATAELLGVHEANLLFKYRADVHPTDDEQAILLQTGVTETNGFVPFWYWTRKETPEAVLWRLLTLIILGNVEEIQKAAVRTIRALKLPVPAQQYLSGVFAELPAASRTDYLAWYVDGASKEGDEFLKGLAKEHPDAAADIERARIRLLARFAPEEAVGQVVVMPRFPQDLKDEFRRWLQDCSAHFLTTLVAGVDDWVAGAAAETLLVRGEIDRQTAQTYWLSNVPRVRYAGAAVLASEGVLAEPKEVRGRLAKGAGDLRIGAGLLGDRPSEGDVDELVGRVMDNASVDATEALIDWIGLDGPLALASLLRREFAVRRETALKALREGFAELRAGTLDKAQREYGMVGRKMLEEQTQKLDDFSRERFQYAVFRVFAEKAPSEVLWFARGVFDSPPRLYKDEIFGAAVKVIASNGEDSDIGLLLRGMDLVYGETKRMFADAIVTLAKSPATRVALLNEANPDVVCALLGAMEKAELLVAKGEVLKLLLHEQALVRMAACEALLRACGPGECEVILNNYLTQQTYFYDVVVWFDRELYAPAGGRLRAAE